MDYYQGNLETLQKLCKRQSKTENIKTKEPNEKAKEVNGRVYLDLSRLITPQAEENKQPRRPNWRLIVDEKTGYKESKFHESKNGMIEPVCQRFKELEQSGKTVKVLQMDNGGENKGLVKRLNSKDWQLYPKIEWTARDTPQQNHMVEVGFATLYG